MLFQCVSAREVNVLARGKFHGVGSCGIFKVLKFVVVDDCRGCFDEGSLVSLSFDISELGNHQGNGIRCVVC